MSDYFKRMSVLARRKGDERGYFAERWRAHGDLVARLPGIRGYVQSHVRGDVEYADFRVDGIVELWFDNPQAMASAFADDAVRAVIEDEPGFLGHATGYNIVDRSAPPTETPDRLIIIDRPQAHTNTQAQLVDLPLISHDVVESVLPKLGQVEPPQDVAAFRQYLWSEDFPAMKTLMVSEILSFPVSSVRII